MKHIMIDLETMGTRFDAPVVAVGAVYFEPLTGEIGRKFYGGVKLGDAFRYGKASGDTVEWWLQQSDAARAALVKGQHPLDLVLNKFKAFCTGGPHGDDVCVWGNGATFDISILEYAFPKVLGEPAPWKFWNVRDCRTIKAVSEGMGVTETKLAGTAHNALDDAVHQVNWVSKMWQVLRGAPSPAKPIESDDLLG